MTRFINTRIHGILDYAVSLLFIVSPWLFNFYQRGAETWMPVVLGVAAMVYSFFTRYELGVVRMLSMRKHLWLDLINGVLLAASPWIFGFSDNVFLPHLVGGILEILVVLSTKPYSTVEQAVTGVSTAI